MIEVIGALFRWMQLASNMILIGGCVFLAIAGRPNTASDTSWPTRLGRTFPWLALAILLGLLGLLATTTAQATGVAENAWRPGSWLELLQKTRIGLIWMVRETLALTVLGVALFVRFSAWSRWRYVLCAIVAGLTLATGSLASHSAAGELSVASVLPYALHIILASIWFGGLPGILTVMFPATGKQLGEEVGRSSIQTLKRFSTMALPVMIGVVATGIIVADRMVDTSYAALVATNYGWLLNTKIALLLPILVIAACARLVWVPSLDQNADVAASGRRGLRKWVTVEFALAVTLVVVATVLANAVPAKHDVIADWPYPFRFSIDATWGDWNVMIRTGVGVAILFLAAGAIPFGGIKRWDIKRRIAIPAALAVSGLAIALPPLAVPAFPETYRKTPVPFDAISVANGATLYAANCVPCHGPQAKGNGVLAKTFAKPPVDLLTEPHTALHTAGDFFHWLTHGIPGTGMPAFADILSEEDRWDVVNFLHATSRGYQARLINSYVAPNQPYMAPQNFSYSAHDGTSGTLKDFRRHKSVLLVLFSWPESRTRLDQLRLAAPALNDSAANTVVLAVPVNDPSPQDMTAITADMPFPVVVQGAQEIARSYALFRRTLSNPDLAGEGTFPKHMEFLIDRYGYLRARWIPSVDGPGWTDIGELMKQIEQLSREKEIRPPPDDHVH
ncbi:MAG TPA: CopD family protein [Nitrospiraceae bacterium]|nr:CopD family protein [Terriglobia bacterium]HSF66166.1 CopD family protein [Nitrospiraceae bacterium]